MLRDVAYAKQRRYLRSFSFWLPIQAPECGSAFDPFCLHPVEGFFVNDGWIEVITEVVLRHQQTFCGSVEGFDPGIIGGILQAHSVEVIGVKHPELSGCILVNHGDTVFNPVSEWCIVFSFLRRSRSAVRIILNDRHLAEAAILGLQRSSFLGSSTY